MSRLGSLFGYFSRDKTPARASEDVSVTDDAVATDAPDDPDPREPDGARGKRKIHQLAAGSPSSKRRRSEDHIEPDAVDAVQHPDRSSPLSEHCSDEDAFPTPRALRASWSNPAAAASFNSSSTLTGLPPSSQFSVASSSRRMWDGGEQIVTNSSSDCEDLERISEEDDEEDEEVDEVELLIARKKQAIALDREQHPAEQEDPVPPRELRRQHPRPVSRPAFPAPPKSTYKHSLAALAKQKRKDEALEARLRALDDMDRRAEARIGALEACGGEGVATAAEAARVLAEEDGDQLRLRQALERADALQHEIGFRFFDAVLEDDPTRLRFPKSVKGMEPWMEVLRDARSPGHAVAFVADICSRRSLPPELQEWCLGEVLFEDRDEVADAYVHLLTQCARHEATSTLLDVPMLRDAMLRLGARGDLVEDHDEELDIMDGLTDSDSSRIGRRGLHHFLLLLASISDKLSTSARGLAVYLVALMLIDDEVAADVALTQRLQQTFDALLEALPEHAQPASFSTTIQNITQRITHPILIHRLLSLLPSSYTSHTTALFRRALAHAHLTSRLPGPSAPHHASWTQLTTLVLSSPLFSPTASPQDFSALAARLHVLDAAIGPGFASLSSTSIFLRVPAPAPTPATATTSSFFAPRQRPAEVDAEAKAFDAAATALAGALRGLAAGIRDAGAAHLRRAECKGVAEGVALRLESVVRVGRGGRRAVFASGGG